MYGPADERESIATIHAALDRGITLLDTGDFYGTGHNEMLIGRAIRSSSSRSRAVNAVPLLVKGSRSSAFPLTGVEM
jgi:aryl-alcohol dehydrogenase-like predicted oxidoreductase